MTVAHSSLTGSNLHENKGVAAATDNFVATATTGATVWQKLTAANLTGTGNPFGGQLLHVQQQQTSGTDGGASTAGTWVKRVLNTTLTNEIASASVGSDQITLPAGTYYIEAHAPSYNTGPCVTRLRNVTDSTDTLIGTAEPTSVAHQRSVTSGRFIIAGTKTFEFQMRTNASSGSGFGHASSQGVTEVYTDVKIWKVL